MQVEDGGNTGAKMTVTREGYANVAAVTASTEHHANAEHGDAYHMVFEVTPTAGDDCFLFLQNDDDKLMTVEGIWLSPAGAAEIYFQEGNAGTRNAAVVNVPAQCNFGSGNTADGTFETGVDLDGGAATLAAGTEFERYIFRAAANSGYFNFEQDIIIPKNGTLTIWSSASVLINGTVVFNYHEVE